LTWILAILISVPLVELALRLPIRIALGRLVDLSLKSLRLIRVSGISDHWKEKAARFYAALILASTLRATVLMSSILGVALLVALTLDQISSGFWAYYWSAQGVGLSMASSCAWIVLRKWLMHRPL
jgi:hypothetical protein